MSNTLSSQQIEQLVQQGCSARDFSLISVAGDFDASQVRNCNFIGKVSVGDLSGLATDANGIEKPCGLYNATIINCTIGNNVRIANVGVHIANYDIADDVCIENVGTMQTNSQATFGNGIEIEVLNEAGGREVRMFDELNAQFAYLMCAHRYRPKMIAKLDKIANSYTQKVKSDRGTIASSVKICSAGEIINVKIGPGAIINSPSSLINGSILSEPDNPTKIGTGVISHNFIISENSSVTSQAILENVFVGQGCQIGEQFSAKHSLFFANCEGFHGEACSIFAGPYTVSHHKSTLLIAVMMSFYNAGSGTNQSNHMYKLGPVHEGKLLRGTKTGSFSYMMWPCRTGPFSVVLGKHSSTFDVEDYPFSHLDARSDGKANFVPGLHLTTVGTVRDGAKWPKRDRRTYRVKRDVINFEVFSPYTIGKMFRASKQLKELQDSTDRSIEEVSIGGAMIRRPILRTGQKYYRNGIEMYLLEKVFERIEQGQDIKVAKDAVCSDDWVDIAGQLMPSQRLKHVEDNIEAGKVETVEQFCRAIEAVNEQHVNDEWAWVKKSFEGYFGIDLDSVNAQQIVEIADKYLKIKSKFLNLIVADAEKEFAELSRTGFGQDGSAAEQQKDFDEVRGTYEKNSFVIEMKKNIELLNQRVEAIKNKSLKQ